MVEVNKQKYDWAELWWPAPAKLNLMLNITGQRDDGYHELQTVFQLLSIFDWLNFKPADDGMVKLVCHGSNIPENENLVMRAALLLKSKSDVDAGVVIELKKVLPTGAGLGGGSSDAATTLVVLNELWALGYSVDELAAFGLELGADVPVFVRGQSAWAEGVGEKISPIELPEQWFVVVNSDHHCSTKEVFAHNCLTRDSEAITIRDFLAGYETNDCFEVVRKMNKELDEMYKLFSQFGTVFLTGTGSSMFAKCDTRQEAVLLSDQLPANWNKWMVRGVNQSPLQKSLKQFFSQVN